MIRTIVSTLLILALTPLTVTAQLREGFFDVELNTVPVAGNVYMIQRLDGFANVGVFVGKESVLLLDSQFEPHAETKIIPGHGLKVVGRQELLQFRDMIVNVSQRVRALIAEGKTLDEVMAAKPSAAYDKQWGMVPSWNQNDFVPIVYRQLGGGSIYEP